MFWNRLVLLPMETPSEVFYFGLQYDLTKKAKNEALAEKRPPEIGNHFKIDLAFGLS
jgi:hypothetical protein